MRAVEITEATYSFRLGKNLGRVNFKTFFENVMTQRPNHLAKGSDDTNPYLLESENMVLRGTLGERGNSVICDAWLATHATTYDAVYQLGDTGSTIDFWVDDKMNLHWRRSDFDSEMVPKLKKLAERWGIDFIIDQ